MKNFTQSVLIVGFGAVVAIGIMGSTYLTKKQALEQASKDAAYRQTEVLLQAEKYKEEKIKECLANAEKRYYEYTKLNATEVNDEKGTYRAPQRVWDNATKERTEARELCFKLYKN